MVLSIHCGFGRLLIKYVLMQMLSSESEKQVFFLTSCGSRYRVGGRRKIVSLPWSVCPPQQGAQQNLFISRARQDFPLFRILGLSSQRAMFSAGPLWDIVVCQSGRSTQCT